MIIQNIAEEGRTDMTFSCPTDQVLRAEKALNSAKNEGDVNDNFTFYLSGVPHHKVASSEIIEKVVELVESKAKEKIN